MITIGKRILLAKTCLGCGHLKQAKDFSMVMKDYRHSSCYKCKNTKARPTMRGHQNRSLDVAVRHRQPWTVEDIHTLSAMLSEGLSGPVMALTLNRTVYAVYTMINKLKEETP